LDLRGFIARAREQLSESPFVRLVFHFFNRSFTGELLSSQSDLQLGIGGILALLVLPGAALPLLLLPKYSSFLRWLVGIRHFDYNTASIPDKYTLLALTMVISGIVAVIKWDSLFPDRLDYANFAPLPSGALQIFIAKLVALWLFIGLFVFALNVTSTIFFPIVVMGEQGNFHAWTRFTSAHVIATVAGSFFMFFLFFAFIGLLMLLPYRWFRHISATVQFLSVILLLTLLFATPEIGALMSHRTWAAHKLIPWLPTVWFLGLYQQLFGRADAGLHHLAVRALEGTGSIVAISLAVYAASYPRYYRRIPESVDAIAAGPGRIRRFLSGSLDSLFLKRPFDRACFHFGLKTLLRSQLHRLVLAGFVGLGVAISIQEVAATWHGEAQAALHLPHTTILSAPSVVIFFLLTGLRFAFNLPAELPANWVFQIAADSEGVHAKKIAKDLMLAFLVPVIIATGVVCSLIWGGWIGIAHATLVLLASVMLMEFLLLDYRKIPFTCTYSAGRQNLGIVLAAYFLAFLLFSSGMAQLEHWALSWRSPVPFLCLLAFLFIDWMGLRYYSVGQQDYPSPLLFEDEPELLIPSMNLR
jgi:hypothetical protein